MLAAACPTPSASPAHPSDIGSPAAAAPDWRRIVQALVLVVATVLCYLPSLNGGFLWDDRALMLDDPLTKSATGLWHIWFSTLPYDYYPLTYTSFWIEWPLWGADPLGYRVVNLALHIGAAFLFWRLLEVWRLPGAWCAALLFALHPLNVASVAWIAERKNTLSMVFYLTALFCWARSAESRGVSPRRACYLAALAAFALALLSKSSVVMLPCVLVLITWWRHGRIRARNIWRTLPFFGLSLAAGLTSLWFQHRAMMPGELATALGPVSRAALVGKTIGFYLCKSWFPHPLSMIYPRWRFTPVQAADFLPLLLLLLLGAGAGWLAVRRGVRGPAAALAYFGISLLPVAGLFNMSFYAVSYVSDHFAYLALLSMYALCAAFLAGAGSRSEARRLAARATLVFLVCASATLTLLRAEEFGSALRLWRNTVALNPGSGAAQNNYGLALDEAHQTKAAEACFRNALRLDPAMPGPLTNLAAVLQEERRWQESADVYRQVVAGPAEPGDYNNYGVVLLYLGDSQGATEQFRAALQLNPLLSSAHYNLYKLAVAAGDEREASRELRASETAKKVGMALRASP